MKYAICNSAKRVIMAPWTLSDFLILLSSKSMTLHYRDRLGGLIISGCEEAKHTHHPHSKGT